MDDRFPKFALGIAEAYYCWHRLAAKELNKYGLKGPHSLYLIGLYGHPEGLTMSDFCAFFFKDKSDVSRMMKILIEKGLVTRDRKYRAAYKLTDEGINIAKKVVDKTDEIVDIARKDITEEEEKIFYACLENITENLRTISSRYKEDEE